MPASALRAVRSGVFDTFQIIYNIFDQSPDDEFLPEKFIHCHPVLERGRVVVSILGAPFMFCEKVSGNAVVPWVSASEPGLEEGYRKRLAEQKGAAKRRKPARPRPKSW